MSEPTQHDRERAAEFAAEYVAAYHDAALRNYGRDAIEDGYLFARVLLALLAEREAAWPTEVTFGGGMRMGKTAAIKALNEARVSGRRAMALELADFAESVGTDNGNFIASHARSMASIQPSTPSKMDDPDE